MNKTAVRKVVKELGWLSDADEDIEAHVARALRDVVIDDKRASREISARILHAALGEETIEADAPTASKPEPAASPDPEHEATIATYNKAVSKLGKARVAEILAYCGEHGVDPVLSLQAELDYVAANPQATRR